MARVKIIGIYSFLNIVNGKRYIGQSNDIYRRERNHRTNLTQRRKENDHFINAWHKYGEQNFEFSILEECSLLDLNDRERYWIAFYQSNDPKYGYNKTSGGQDSCEKISSLGDESGHHVLTQSKVQEIIIRLINGEYCSDIAKDYNVCASTIVSIKAHKTWQFLTEGIYFPKVSSKYVPAINKCVSPRKVDMYRLDGTYICTFESTHQAAQAVGQKDISPLLRGKGISVKGYVFRYHGHPFDEFTTRKLVSQLKPVDQYDLNWNYIQTFDSVTDANRAYSSRSICRALKDVNYTAYGFHWLYHGETPPIGIAEHWRLDQYDLDWNYICSYKTTPEAARVINKDPSTINHILNYPNKTAGGYHWLRHGEQPPIAI